MYILEHVWKQKCRYVFKLKLKQAGFVCSSQELATIAGPRSNFHDVEVDNEMIAECDEPAWLWAESVPQTCDWGRFQSLDR